MNDPQREAFFNQLYSRYYRIIFAYLLSHVSDREASQDLLQEAFLRVWNQLHVGLEMGLDGSRYWIYRIAKNLAIDYYRRRSTQIRTRENIKNDVVNNRAVSPSAEDALITKERILHVEKAIGRLPEDLYRVLILQCIGEMNSSEIGELLEVPAGTIRYRLSMARKQLRQELEPCPTEGVEP